MNGAGAELARVDGVLDRLGNARRRGQSFLINFQVELHIDATEANIGGNENSVSWGRRDWLG